MSRGVLVKVAHKLVIIAMCLSCVAFVGACNSKSTDSSSPAPSPAELTPAKQAARYFKELAPVLKADKALSKKTPKLTRMEFKDLDDAYSVAAAIKSAFLPDVQRIRELLATIDPPPQFRVAHARLRRVWALTYDFLYFMADTLQRAVFTHALDPGFNAKGDRYMARLRKLSRQYDAALRAGARESQVKVPKRLLIETSL
jgi:hypothetical protein